MSEVDGGWFVENGSLNDEVADKGRVEDDRLLGNRSAVGSCVDESDEEGFVGCGEDALAGKP